MAQEHRLSFLQAAAQRGWVVYGVDDQHCIVELPKRLWKPGVIAGGLLFIAGGANLIFVFPAVLLWVGILWEYLDRQKRLYCLTWEQIEKHDFPDEMFMKEGVCFPDSVSIMDRLIPSSGPSTSQ